jgi:AcrR family transcriptional regulator
METRLQRGQRSTQRERLLAGMIEAANRDGYARATVSAVIGQAGVSRPTFYQYFPDRDACFAAAVREVQRQVLERITHEIGVREPESALYGAIEGFVGFAVGAPERMRFLTNEPMAGGPAALAERDRGIAEIDALIEDAYRLLARDTHVPDFSALVLMGGIHRLLASRLRRGEPNLSGLVADLLTWVAAYERPLADARWRALEPLTSPAPSPFVGAEPLSAPDPLPAGRPRKSGEEVAENQRQRIMFAAARLAERQGYTATTIGDITKLAGVDGRVFYSLFVDKQDAFMAVHELGFQRVMDVTATAFFAGATWPERHWEAGRAFAQFLELNPLVTNVGFVEAYAVGPGAVQRLEDSHGAFSMLLQEGYQHVSPQARPPRLVLEAIITTIFETVYQRARADGELSLSGLVPHLTFLVLAPFLGAEQASAFVEGKLREPAPA